MTTHHDDGGEIRALPTNILQEMTLRDYLAGQALVPFMTYKLTRCRGDADCYDADSAAAFYARNAYLIADAMLAARSRPAPGEGVDDA